MQQQPEQRTPTAFERVALELQQRGVDTATAFALAGAGAGAIQGPFQPGSLPPSPYLDPDPDSTHFLQFLAENTKSVAMARPGLPAPHAAIKAQTDTLVVQLQHLLRVVGAAGTGVHSTHTLAEAAARALYGLMRDRPCVSGVFLLTDVHALLPHATTRSLATQDPATSHGTSASAVPLQFPPLAERPQLVGNWLYAPEPVAGDCVTDTRTLPVLLAAVVPRMFDALRPLLQSTGRRCCVTVVPPVLGTDKAAAASLLANVLDYVPGTDGDGFTLRTAEYEGVPPGWVQQCVQIVQRTGDAARELQRPRVVEVHSDPVDDVLLALLLLQSSRGVGRVRGGDGGGEMADPRMAVLHVSLGSETTVGIESAAAEIARDTGDDSKTLSVLGVAIAWFAVVGSGVWPRMSAVDSGSRTAVQHAFRLALYPDNQPPPTAEYGENGRSIRVQVSPFAEAVRRVHLGAVADRGVLFPPDQATALSCAHLITNYYAGLLGIAPGRTAPDAAVSIPQLTRALLFDRLAGRSTAQPGTPLDFTAPPLTAEAEARLLNLPYPGDVHPLRIMQRVALAAWHVGRLLWGHLEPLRSAPTNVLRLRERPEGAAAGDEGQIVFRYADCGMSLLADCGLGSWPEDGSVRGLWREYGPFERFGLLAANTEDVMLQLPAPRGRVTGAVGEGRPGLGRSMLSEISRRLPLVTGLGLVPRTGVGENFPAELRALELQGLVARMYPGKDAAASPETVQQVREMVRDAPQRLRTVACDQVMVTRDFFNQFAATLAEFATPRGVLPDETLVALYLYGKSVIEFDAQDGNPRRFITVVPFASVRYSSGPDAHVSAVGQQARADLEDPTLVGWLDGVWAVEMLEEDATHATTQAAAVEYLARIAAGPRAGEDRVPGRVAYLLSRGEPALRARIVAVDVDDLSPESQQKAHSLLSPLPEACDYIVPRMTEGVSEDTWQWLQLHLRAFRHSTHAAWLGCLRFKIMQSALLLQQLQKGAGAGVPDGLGVLPLLRPLVHAAIREPRMLRRTWAYTYMASVGLSHEVIKNHENALWSVLNATGPQKLLAELGMCIPLLGDMMALITHHAVAVYYIGWRRESVLLHLAYVVRECVSSRARSTESLFSVSLSNVSASLAVRVGERILPLQFYLVFPPVK